VGGAIFCTTQQLHYPFTDVAVLSSENTSDQKSIVHTSVLTRTYDDRTFTATTVVSYHGTNTAITVSYCVHGGLSGRCFLKTAPHFGSVI